MSREFGIYPDNMSPQCWIGCRGIITKRNTLDIPWDRWSSEFRDEAQKQDLINFVNNEAIKEVENRLKKYDKKGFFDSADGRFRCEYNDKNSDGYLYIGFYTNFVETRG